MSFHFPVRERTDKFANVVTFSVQGVRRNGGPVRAQMLIGRAVMEAMGWASDKSVRVIVGYGEPGTEDYGWAQIKRAKDGYGVRPAKAGQRNGYFQTQFLPPWITAKKHAASKCAWRKAGSDAIEIKLPDWALIEPAPTHNTHATAEPADTPPAAPRRRVPAVNQIPAQAGGSDSPGDFGAPPAEILSRGESREEAPTSIGEQPGSEPAHSNHFDEASPAEVRSGGDRSPSDQTAASILGLDETDANDPRVSTDPVLDGAAREAPAAAVSETSPPAAGRSFRAESDLVRPARPPAPIEEPSAEQIGDGRGTARRSTTEDRAAEESASAATAAVAPDTRGLKGQRLAIYNFILAAAARGAETPTYLELAKVIDREHPVQGQAVISVLEQKGLVRREGDTTSRSYFVVAIGKRTKARNISTLPPPIAPPKPAEPPPASEVSAPTPSVAPDPAPAPFKNGPLPEAPPAAKPTAPEPRQPAAAAPNPVPLKDVIAWLNNAGVPCMGIGGGTFLLDGSDVERRQVIERANWMRRRRKEPEFVVAP